MTEAQEILAEASEKSKWVNPWPASHPRSINLEYQEAFIADKSRFKIGLWSRQTGKDHSGSCEAIQDCYEGLVDGRGGAQWMVAAPSERQSLETLDKARQWAEGYGAVIDDFVERREGGATEQLLKSAEITIAMKNGGGKARSKFRAVPGRPETVRGISSNVLITEGDFFEKPKETMRALLPSITNPLKGGEKKLRVITTPNGIGSMAHGIWTKTGGKLRWSKHKVTIYDAVRMGLPVDIEELREALDDPEGWSQEYNCEFIDTASVLLGYELIAAVENQLATTGVAPGYWAPQNSRPFPIDLGIDFGRKKDLTVCWATEDLGGFQMTREVLELAGMPTHLQFEELAPRVAASRGVSFDYTGPGIGLGDLLVAKFGEWKPEAHKYGKVELVTFTNQIKCELFPALRSKFEARMYGLPVSRAIREDLHSMCRVTTPGGSVTYKAPHTEDGHADRCTAAALNVRAHSRAGLNVGQFLFVQP